MTKKEDAEYARRVLKAIEDTQENDATETVLLTYENKSQVINIKNDLGNLKNAIFGSLHPHIINFETGFSLLTKKIIKIEVVSVGKNVISRGQKF
jgi:hypothetical protein